MLTLFGRKNLPVIGKVEANPGDNQKPVNNLLGLKTMKHSCYIILFFAFFVFPSQVKGNNKSESNEEIAEEMLTYMVSNNCKHFGREKIYAIVLKNIDYSDIFLKKNRAFTNST